MAPPTRSSRARALCLTPHASLRHSEPTHPLHHHSQAMRVYLDFIRRRATGELQTGAEWMRTFVKAHPGERLRS